MDATQLRPNERTMVERFNPPLYKQRQQLVIDFVARTKPKKVVDFGCNECSLLRKLKFHKEIEVLSGVDIDGAVVKKKMHTLAPLTYNYLRPSFRSLNIQLYQGSVTQKDARLRGFDLVTSIELIEHLQLADVSRFSEVVFGYMTPMSVIVTTPNAEFNTLFCGRKGFRHHDHKFEWTRAEFQCWALKVCAEYGYDVTFTGVGEPPPGMLEKFGFCSQIAVFIRICDTQVQPRDDVGDDFSYTLLYNIHYPSLNDANILKKILSGEVMYWSKQLQREWKKEMARERDDDLTFCQTEGDGKKKMEMKESHTGFEETKDLAAWSEKYAPVYEEFGMKGEGLEEFYRQERCVYVPLARLWSRCPQIKALSGSLCHLRQLLLDSPSVRLTPDGSAVLVDDDDQGEKCEDDLEDTGGTKACQWFPSAVEENWQTGL